MTTDPKPLELRECPFCGGSAVMTNAPAYDGGSEWFNVECCKCTATVEGGYEEADAITAWHRRAVDREMVEKIVEMARQTEWIEAHPYEEDCCRSKYSADEIIAELERTARLTRSG